MPKRHVEHILLGDLFEMVDDHLTHRLNVPELNASSMMTYMFDQYSKEFCELSKVVRSQLEALQAHFYVIS